MYGTTGTRCGSSAELQRAYEQGKVVITTLDGNAADYNKELKLFSSKTLPNIIEMKKTDYECLSSSPRRYFTGNKASKPGK